jgi:hypothetical protein
MREGSDGTPLLMALLVGAKVLVVYRTNLVSNFNLEVSCFGEQSFYYCFGVHRLPLVTNFTPLQASPVRKRAHALKVIARCWYYNEGSFIVHETFTLTSLN